MKGLLLAVQFEGMATRRDKTVTIKLSTQELTPDKAGEIFHLNGQVLTAYFTHEQPSAEDIEIVDSIEPDIDIKSPSQRQRNILYRIWENNKAGYTDFNLYYMFRMEQNITKLKKELDDKTL